MSDRGPLPHSTEGSWIHPNKNEDLSKIPEIKSAKSSKKVRFDDDSAVPSNLESRRKSNNKSKTQKGGKVKRKNKKTIKKRK